MHKTYEANTKGKDYIVSDLHGCYHGFCALLQEIGFDKKVDRMFSVGDLVDRGPNNYKCLMLMYEDWFIPVKGNHEDLFYKAIREDGMYLWTVNGGNWHDRDDVLIGDVADDANALPVFITLEHSSGKRVGISHAEAPTGDWNDVDTIEKDSHEHMAAIWGRTRIEYGGLPIDNIDYTVHGHTIIRRPRIVGNSLYIDTGSFLGLDKFKAHDGHITIISVDDLCSGVYDDYNLDKGEG